MKIEKLQSEFGKDAKNKLEQVNQTSFEGALACLETFYYSFNNKDLNILREVWYQDDLIQLNNPLGGIARGIQPVTEVYNKIFNSQATIWVKLTDIICYATKEMAVFAGTEIGEFSTTSETIPLKIRTSRVFDYLEKENRWFQIHHHGSIDDADLLKKYQEAVKK